MDTLGIVRELPVRAGQRVKKGDLLLKLDDREDQAELKALELEANSNVRIEAARADLKVKQVQLQRIQDLRKINNATASELEEAEVKVVYAEAQVKIEELAQQTNKLKAEKQRFRVERMKMTSAVDGFVQEIYTSVGAVTDPQKPVMTVVPNDPVWIEFFLPVQQAQRLKLDGMLQVKYLDDAQWQNAKVIYRAPVADAASDTQKIRLAMPNTMQKDTGLQVQVKLPAELGPVQQNPAAAAAATVTPAVPALPPPPASLR
jgi:RND family efflux transporter MFP subunit